MKGIKKVILASVAIAMLGISISIFTGSEAQAYIKKVDCYHQYRIDEEHVLVFCLPCEERNGIGTGAIDSCSP